jgi:hypothetical protein
MKWIAEMNATHFDNGAEGAVMRWFRLAMVSAAVALLAACAHPISITAKDAPEKAAAPSTKKVAYALSDTQRQAQVTTPGGGGDKISYFPYRDFEKSLRAALLTAYADVTAVPSIADKAALRDTGASFIFVPEISTNSSSPSAFTWPPTKFSITVAVDVLEPSGAPVAKLVAQGDGAAEWSEFKSEFGLAGRRAVESAAKDLAEQIQRNEKLR